MSDHERSLEDIYDYMPTEDQIDELIDQNKEIIALLKQIDTSINMLKE